MDSTSRDATVTPFSETTLFESLSNKFCSPVEVAASARAKYLFAYLCDLGAKTIVVENDYVDRDYLDDYAAYYASCFRRYERHCRRVHFFKNGLTAENLWQAVRRESGAPTPEALNRDYLGFVVARPLPVAIVGRTVLRTYEPDGGRRNYTCVRQYHANLFGIPLQLESLAFQEQDTVLAACATVALWCSFHKAADLYQTPAPSPASITRVASRVSRASRPIPSHGLSVEQMCAAISHIGLEPEVFVVTKSTPLASLLVGHLAAGLPAVLCVAIEGGGHHALTVAGYSMRPQQHLPQEVAPGEKAVPMTGLFVDEFYAHDDQFGPFSRLVIKPSEQLAGQTFPVTLKGSWLEATTAKELTLFPLVVIFPVYHKIRVTFLDLQKWLERLTGLLWSLVLPQSTLLWNVRLTTTNVLKGEVRASDLPADVRETLLMRGHPRFIWRAELTLDGQPVLEFLADATDMDRSFPLYACVWKHEGFRSHLSDALALPEAAHLLTTLLTTRFHEFLTQPPDAGSLTWLPLAQNSPS